MADYKDYYAILGLKKTATAEEIKQAYRRLAKEHHPDLQPEKSRLRATEKFKEINEAYEALSDPQKRSVYDTIGPDWRPPPQSQRPAGGAGPSRAPRQEQRQAGFSDFFEDLFGEGHGLGDIFGGGRGQPRDSEAEIALSLEEAMQGGERRFTLSSDGPCPACGGTGRRGNALCPQCRGSGVVAQERTVTTQFPRFVHDGTRLRLRGQGSVSPGGERGDLFITIRLKPHPLYHVEGSDLVASATVMPWDAVLGGEISVPTLEGPVRVRIQPATHTGRRLRIAGRGLVKEGGTRGDLYAVVKVDIPERIDARLQKLFQTMKDERG